jgi:hypothetical protein
VNHDEELRRRMQSLDEERPSGAHDAAVLERAQRTAQNIRARSVSKPTTRRWVWPASLAASLLIGMLAMRVIDVSQNSVASGPPLAIPADAARGTTGRSIPVEEASADDWYRYIQELVAAGETREAERHLRRFNELHPDYAYQP